MAAALARVPECSSKTARRKCFSAGGACGADIGCDCRASGPDTEGDGCEAAPVAHSNQQECAFAVFRAPRRHPQKKACKPPNGSERTWPARVDAGCGSRACLT